MSRLMKLFGAWKKAVRRFCLRRPRRHLLDEWCDEHGTKPEDINSHLTKYVNRVIYCGGGPGFTGTPEAVVLLRGIWVSRMRTLYGDDWYTWPHYDPQVGELLLRTGKWEELPDELQDEYHRRAGGGYDEEHDGARGA